MLKKLTQILIISLLFLQSSLATAACLDDIFEVFKANNQHLNEKSLNFIKDYIYPYVGDEIFIDKNKKPRNCYQGSECFIIPPISENDDFLKIIFSEQTEEETKISSKNGERSLILRKNEDGEIAEGIQELFEGHSLENKFKKIFNKENSSLSQDNLDFLHTKLYPIIEKNLYVTPENAVKKCFEGAECLLIPSDNSSFIYYKVNFDLKEGEMPKEEIYEFEKVIHLPKSVKTNPLTPTEQEALKSFFELNNKNITLNENQKSKETELPLVKAQDIKIIDAPRKKMGAPQTSVKEIQERIISIYNQYGNVSVIEFNAKDSFHDPVKNKTLSLLSFYQGLLKVFKDIEKAEEILKGLPKEIANELKENFRSLKKLKQPEISDLLNENSEKKFDSQEIAKNIILVYEKFKTVSVINKDSDDFIQDPSQTERKISLASIYDQLEEASDSPIKIMQIFEKLPEKIKKALKEYFTFKDSTGNPYSPEPQKDRKRGREAIKTEEIVQRVLAIVDQYKTATVISYENELSKKFFRDPTKDGKNTSLKSVYINIYKLSKDQEKLKKFLDGLPEEVIEVFKKKFSFIKNYYSSLPKEESLERSVQKKETELNIDSSSQKSKNQPIFNKEKLILDVPSRLSEEESIINLKEVLSRETLNMTSSSKENLGKLFNLLLKRIENERPLRKSSMARINYQFNQKIKGLILSGEFDSLSISNIRKILDAILNIKVKNIEFLVREIDENSKYKEIFLPEFSMASIISRRSQKLLPDIVERFIIGRFFMQNDIFDEDISLDSISFILEEANKSVLESLNLKSKQKKLNIIKLYNETDEILSKIFQEKEVSLVEKEVISENVSGPIEKVALDESSEPLFSIQNITIKDVFTVVGKNQDDVQKSDLIFSQAALKQLQNKKNDSYDIKIIETSLQNGSFKEIKSRLSYQIPLKENESYNISSKLYEFKHIGDSAFRLHGCRIENTYIVLFFINKSEEKDTISTKKRTDIKKKCIEAYETFVRS